MPASRDRVPVRFRLAPPLARPGPNTTPAAPTASATLAGPSPNAAQAHLQGRGARFRTVDVHGADDTLVDGVNDGGLLVGT